MSASAFKTAGETIGTTEDVLDKMAMNLRKRYFDSLKSKLSAKKGEKETFAEKGGEKRLFRLIRTRCGR